MVIFLPLWIEALSVHQAPMRVMILWISLTNLNIIAPIMNSQALKQKARKKNQALCLNLICPEDYRYEEHQIVGSR